MKPLPHTQHRYLAGLLFVLLCFCPYLRIKAQGHTQDNTVHVHARNQAYGHRKHGKILNLLWKADSLLTVRYRRINTDTTYVIRPKSKWVIKTRGNLSGVSLYMIGMAHGNKYSAYIQSDVKGTLNLAVGYLGLSVGVSVNPASWAGKYKDYEFNLNSYSNRWGIDLIYHNQQSAGGWIRRDGQEEKDIPHGSILSKTANLNAYFAFNYKRFSIPAAFSQSYIQKRSAGSWLLGLSLMWQRIESEHTLDAGITVSKLSSLNVAIGAGYGYNFAMRKQWLLHISALPTLVVWNKNELWDGNGWHKEQMHVPDVIVAGRMALIKNYKRNFMGASLIFNFSALGESDRMRVHTTKWRARLFYGWRF